MRTLTEAEAEKIVSENLELKTQLALLQFHFDELMHHTKKMETVLLDEIDITQ